MLAATPPAMIIQTHMLPSHHIPILAETVVEQWIPATMPIDTQSIWIDCTFGGGGHTRQLLQLLQSRQIPHQVIGLDQDETAIARGRQAFASEIAGGRLQLLHGHFADLKEHLDGVTAPITGIFADLGFSSDQMDDPERGLSFRSDGPLDMRLDPSRGLPLSSRLGQLRESEIADILWNFGEERHSRRIARQIFDAWRSPRKPTTPAQLAEIIAHAMPGGKHGAIHPATRSFQALRIWINGELDELDILLQHAPQLLAPEGRLLILSFHSLEDRRVKERFRALASEGGYSLLSKKPLVPSDAEQAKNPRSRSAKLRGLIRKST